MNTTEQKFRRTNDVEFTNPKSNIWFETNKEVMSPYLKQEKAGYEGTIANDAIDHILDTTGFIHLKKNIELI